MAERGGAGAADQRRGRALRRQSPLPGRLPAREGAIAPAAASRASPCSGLSTACTQRRRRSSFVADARFAASCGEAAADELAERGLGRAAVGSDELALVPAAWYVAWSEGFPDLRPRYASRELAGLRRGAAKSIEEIELSALRRARGRQRPRAAEAAGGHLRVRDRRRARVRPPPARRRADVQRARPRRSPSCRGPRRAAGRATTSGAAVLAQLDGYWTQLAPVVSSASRRRSWPRRPLSARGDGRGAGRPAARRGARRAARPDGGDHRGGRLPGDGHRHGARSRLHARRVGHLAHPRDRLRGGTGPGVRDPSRGAPPGRRLPADRRHVPDYRDRGRARAAAPASSPSSDPSARSRAAACSSCSRRRRRGRAGSSLPRRPGSPSASGCSRGSCRGRGCRRPAPPRTRDGCARRPRITVPVSGDPRTTSDWCPGAWPGVVTRSIPGSSSPSPTQGGSGAAADPVLREAALRRRPAVAPARAARRRWRRGRSGCRRSRSRSA